MTQPQIYGTAEHPYSTLPETKEDRAALQPLWPCARLCPTLADHLAFSLARPRPAVPWADLISLDLGLFDQPGGKQKLADQVRPLLRRCISIV